MRRRPSVNHDVMLRRTFFGCCSGRMRSADVAWWAASHCPKAKFGCGLTNITKRYALNSRRPANFDGDRSAFLVFRPISRMAAPGQLS